MSICRSLRVTASLAALFAGALLAGQARAAEPPAAASTSPASAASAASRARLASTTALTVASAAGANGSAVLLQATVDGRSNAAPGGSVVFTAQGKVLGEAPVANGAASLTVNALPAGLSTLAAAYKGDGTFLPSKSATVRFYNDDQD